MEKNEKKGVVSKEKMNRAMLKDKTSAGNKVNMRFLVDYMTYVPEIESEQFDICVNVRRRTISCSEQFVKRKMKSASTRQRLFCSPADVAFLP